VLGVRDRLGALVIETVMLERGYPVVRPMDCRIASWSALRDGGSPRGLGKLVVGPDRR
jgi:hypothetical protein